MPASVDRTPTVTPEVAALTGVSAPNRYTCPEATINEPLPGIELADRALTEFSSTLVGVETTYSNSAGDQTIQIMSGGYADEITESYDNLLSVDSVEVAGVGGDVLEGSLLTSKVRLVFWQVPGVESPCGMHVLIATNVPDAVFEAAVAGIGVTGS
jgi:hypothetical protein